MPLTQQEREFFTLWVVLYGTSPVPLIEMVSNTHPLYMPYVRVPKPMAYYRQLGYVTTVNQLANAITQKTLDELNEKE